MSAPDLDELDYAILAQLQEDGRRPFKEIAQSLSVSSSTVANRYQRLLAEGFVRIHAYVDPPRVGFGSPAFIGVKVRPGQLEQVAAELARLPEADYVAIVSGRYDIDVTVSCRDHQHLLAVITRIHAVDGVVDTQSTIILKMVKYGQASVRLIGGRDGDHDGDRDGDRGGDRDGGRDGGRGGGRDGGRDGGRGDSP